MIKKVAFLALTYDRFQNEELMQKFFSKKASHLYSLYIHNKHELIDSVFSRNCLPRDQIVDTKWGSYSLVRAAVRLMLHALKDPDNEYFVLISDSHCPLYCMEEMYSVIERNFAKLSFSDQPREKSIAKKRFLNSLDKRRLDYCPLDKESGKFASQFFICRRSDAQAFVDSEPKLRKWFDQNCVAIQDETYFYSLADYLKLDYQVKGCCHFNWYLPSKKGFVEYGIREYPKTYSKIPNKMIDILRNQYQYLFVRKICGETKIDQNYLFNECQKNQ